MPRNDTRTAAPNIFGKPGKTYAGDVPEFPRIIETRTANQETPIKAIGTPHDRIAGAFLISQNSQPGDDTDCVITEIYETLPGPYVHYTRNDVVLGPVVGKKRVVRYTGQVGSISDTVRITYEPRDETAIVFYETTETNLTPGQPLAGQRYLPQYDCIAPYIAQVFGYTGASGDLHVTGLEGDAGTEITPVDEGAARTEVLDLDAIRAALLAIHHSWQSRISIPLPNVLTSVIITSNESYGEGSDSHPASQQNAEFVSGSAILTVALSPRSTSQSSASVIPDVQPVIKYYSEAGRGLQANNYTFFLYNNATEADILAKLSTIIGGSPVLNFLPVFVPRSDVITCKGQQVSVRQSADTNASVSANADNVSRSWQYGSGGEISTGVSTRTVVLPPTIHGTVSFSGSAGSPRTVTTSVDASTPHILIDSGTAISPLSNAPTGLSLTATPSVTPSSLDPTSPSSVPISGLYVPDTTTALADYGMLMIHAAVIDLAQLSIIAASGTLSPNIVGAFTTAGLAGGKGYYTRVVSGVTYYLWYDGTNYWNITAGNMTLGADYWQITATGNPNPSGTYNPHGSYTGTLTIGITAA